MVLDTEFAQKLYYDYLRYREPSFKSRKINYSDITLLTEHLQNKNIFNVNKAGESEEGRSINVITFGEGITKVFLWSQMHGDESTATMAIFDILNFLSADDDFNPCRKKFKKKLNIYFMPMVNPDGAELFQRENYLNIDVNRDAVRKQTAEGRVLFNTFMDIKADFGFNLHDQDRIYTAGLTDNSAAISFLAPAYNYRRDINRVRSRAMKLIVKTNDVLNRFIPGHIAKYSDEFEPRAFGDNFQRLGTSTILIESGNWKNDDEKQFIRKLNFIGLLSAFKSISEDSYRKAELEAYDNIPNNEKYMLDLVIRNVKYEKNNKLYKVDIGISKKEKKLNGSGNFFYESNIEEIGDLSVYHGFEDYDFDGYSLHHGKLFPEEFQTLEEIKNINFYEMYKQGFLFVKLRQSAFSNECFNIPINISLNHAQFNPFSLKAGIPSNFYLVKNSEVRYIIINGFLLNLRSYTGEVKNGMIFRDI